ncbi:ribosomal protein S18-alanine N-acetyltransferase [Roseisolibacter sp. H3M3-2]|uniref:ribosomal protein S18-alanine N-acetyltransferase n=1 Tax=Roseisolibacter sp. H3M3-2 TaxID=3031323 RepID=UPI0023D9E8A7|nr:ribosomal protein S18-alanine N-acetyltransferase [Roseisolibacter sp. H3M3-2]MDF1506324.1 ribosomal protein S18-alanine N-acetyltransferase [Roseisolibacter sp. H3M3-2]
MTGARTAGGRAARLRPATDGDVEAVAAIERASFGDPWSRDSFASLVHNPDAFFAVADDGAPLGYVVAWFVLDEGEVANVAVAAAARGRGIGARLLDAALDEARRRGAAQVFLEVRESNAVARRLYESRGFEELGRRRRYYRAPVEDALVLRLSLPAGAAG